VAIGDIGSEGAPVRVLVVEDDDFTRVTLKAAIERYGLDVVATASDAKTAVTRAVETGAHVGVFDLDLGPGPTGLDVAHGIRRVIPDFGVVLLTSYEDPRLLSSSLATLPAGAAYVVKQSLEDLGFLIEAIKGSRTGEFLEADVPRVDLTDAQVETLRLLACGLTNAEIARVRVVEVKSVEQTISRTAKRLGLDGDELMNQRVALARAYYRLVGAQGVAHESPRVR
jgi:DNA-binding NarL/FixJ family response regulator